MMLEALLEEMGDDRLSVETVQNGTEEDGRYLAVNGMRYPEPMEWAYGSASEDQLRSFVGHAIEQTGRALSTMLNPALTTLARNARPGL